MGTVREKMKVFLVIGLMSITFFSQGWAGKHYLVKTKEKGKQAPEPGQDYTDYGNEDDDVVYNGGNAVDDNAVDDDTYHDDINDDDDTYDDDENNGEEFDAESFIEDNLDEKAKKDLDEMGDEEYEETLELIKEAAYNRGEGSSEDYNHNLKALKLMLEGAQNFLKGVLRILEKVTSETLSTYSVTDCEWDCRSQCKETSFSRSSSSSRSRIGRRGRKGKGRKKKSKGHSINRTTKSCRSRCRSKCRGREWGK